MQTVCARGDLDHWDWARDLPADIEAWYRATRNQDIDVFWEGTIDYVDPTGRAWDWKTAGQAYQRWEKQRWDVQSSIYTTVLHQMGYTTMPATFIFGVMHKQEGTRDGFPYVRPAKTQMIEVQRHEAHTRWVTQQALGMVKFILRNGVDEPWPVNDQHALCSQKWCPFWDGCKGAHVSAADLFWRPE
jgi:hypothetical protein